MMVLNMQAEDRRRRASFGGAFRMRHMGIDFGCSARQRAPIPRCVQLRDGRR